KLSRKARMPYRYERMCSELEDYFTEKECYFAVREFTNFMYEGTIPLITKVSIAEQRVLESEEEEEEE
ncbi:MAG: hypothetical protein AABY22_11635, partial [Nanoarchaeota archaeon]